MCLLFFFSSRRRHTRFKCDWSSDVCSSDLEFGNGYDVVLLTNFLHHFDAATNEKLLRKVNAALKPGARAVTLEFVPNEDRVTPAVAAKFSLTMLAATDHGDAYTFPEYEKMFRNAGFSSSTIHPIPPAPEQVILSVKSG